MRVQNWESQFEERGGWSRKGREKGRNGGLWARGARGWGDVRTCDNVESTADDALGVRPVLVILVVLLEQASLPRQQLRSRRPVSSVQQAGVEARDDRRPL
eukprot:2164072-Rhodomonas_salina.2